MPVRNIEIKRHEPYVGGEIFGDSGAYEQINGTITFAVDPEHPANEGIIDLELAPRDEFGRVQFTSDFCLLQPADPA